MRIEMKIRPVGESMGYFGIVAPHGHPEEPTGFEFQTAIHKKKSGAEKEAKAFKKWARGFYNAR